MGLATLLENKLLREKWQSFLAPQIGYLFCNDQFAQTQEQPTMFPKANGEFKSLVDVATLSLAGLNEQFFASLAQLTIEPLACIRNIDSLNCRSQVKHKQQQLPKTADRPIPITLYHKVGHGTLYMYVLNPTLEGITRPQPAVNANGEVSATIPEADKQSICSLLIWRPHDHHEKVVRILIPGNCTQDDIIEGFETLVALSKVSSRVSRYAPKPRNSDESVPVDIVELDLLLSLPYPCTGENVDTLLKIREDEKGVKFQITSQTLGSLHGYRRSASVAPKVISRRQEQNHQQQQQQHSKHYQRQRSTTPSRFSRFRSVSPTSRTTVSRARGDQTSTQSVNTTAPIRSNHVVNKLVSTGSRTTSKATSQPQEPYEFQASNLQAKVLSRPPSSASSGDRRHRIGIVGTAILSPLSTTNRSIANSDPSKQESLPISKIQSSNRPSLLVRSHQHNINPQKKPHQTEQLIQSSAGKVFKSGKEFRKNTEASKSTKDKQDATQPRPVPRRVKKPEVHVLDIEATKVTDIGTEVEPTSLHIKEKNDVNEVQSFVKIPNSNIPQNETFKKEKFATVEIDNEANDMKNYELDNDDLSIRSITDEEVLKITQLIEEREKAVEALALSESKISSPAVEDSLATEIETDEDHSNSTLTDGDVEYKGSKRVTVGLTEMNLESDVVLLNIAVTATPTSPVPSVIIDDYETDRDLELEELEDEPEIAPPPPTPARPGSEEGEIQVHNLNFATETITALSKQQKQLQISLSKGISDELTEIHEDQKIIPGKKNN